MKKEYFESRLSPEMQRAKIDGRPFKFDSPELSKGPIQKINAIQRKLCLRAKALLRYALGNCQNAETRSIASDIERKVISRIGLTEGNYDDAVTALILEGSEADLDIFGKLEQSVNKNLSHSNQVKNPRKPFVDMAKEMHQKTSA